MPTVRPFALLVGLAASDRDREAIIASSLLSCTAEAIARTADRASNPHGDHSSDEIDITTTERPHLASPEATVGRHSKCQLSGSHRRHLAILHLAGLTFGEDQLQVVGRDRDHWSFTDARELGKLWKFLDQACAIRPNTLQDRSQDDVLVAACAVTHAG